MKMATCYDVTPVYGTYKSEGRGICHKVGAPKPCVYEKVLTEPRRYVIILGPFSQDDKVIYGFYVFRGNNTKFIIWVLIKLVLKTMKTSKNMTSEPSAAHT
jgi:hypothetical protein